MARIERAGAATVTARRAGPVPRREGGRGRIGGVPITNGSVAGDAGGDARTPATPSGTAPVPAAFEGAPPPAPEEQEPPAAPPE